MPTKKAPTKGPRESRWNETPSAFESRWKEKHGDASRWTTFPTGEESPLHIPDVEGAAASDGMELMWAVDTVLGKPTEVGGVKFAAKKGWMPVQKGEWGADIVETGGLVLVARPTKLGDKERNIEKAAAEAAPARLRQRAGAGDLPMTGADHPSARRSNKHVRTFERIEVPDHE